MAATTRTRRGYGEGSIGRLGKRWRVRISVRGVDGRRKQLAVYAKTQAEARKLLLSTARQRAQQGNQSHIGETLEQYLRRWLGYAEKTTRPTTYGNYRLVCERHIVPIIGKVRLADLTPEHVDAVTSHAVAAGLSSGSVKNVRAALATALNRAVKWQIPGARNVVAMTAGPKVKHREQRYLDRDQAQQLLAAIQATPMEAFFALALYSGMRLGELQALSWEDVDFERQTLRVRRSYRDGMGISDPKTTHSTRTLDLSDPMMAVLKSRRKAQMLDQAEAGKQGVSWLNRWSLVFTGPFGRPTSRNSIHRELAALLRKAGLPRIRLHDLRHTCATLQLAAGVQPKVVQENLGHSKISTTLDLYAHVMPTTRREPADTLAALLG